MKADVCMVFCFIQQYLALINATTSSLQSLDKSPSIRVKLASILHYFVCLHRIKRLREGISREIASAGIAASNALSTLLASIAGEISENY